MNNLPQNHAGNPGGGNMEDFDVLIAFILFAEFVEALKKKKGKLKISLKISFASVGRR